METMNLLISPRGHENNRSFTLSIPDTPENVAKLFPGASLVPIKEKEPGIFNRFMDLFGYTMSETKNNYELLLKDEQGNNRVTEHYCRLILCGSPISNVERIYLTDIVQLLLLGISQ